GSEHAFDQADPVVRVDPGAVIAGAAVDVLADPVAREQPVVAGPAEQEVGAAATFEEIAARPAVERVVAATPSNDIVAAEAADDLRTSGSDEDVTAGRPDDRAAFACRRECPRNPGQAMRPTTGGVRDVDLGGVVRGAREDELLPVARPGRLALVRVGSLHDS